MKTSVRTLLFMLLMALVSCSGNQGARALLERVDSLMEENPEAALALLDSAEEASYEYPHGQKMRYELLRAKAMNKAYVDFTSDSVMKEVVEYYDAHGTANEKVEAHYLLGCVYRDLHESPAALNCYYDAVECADTLSEDCDYGMLMRVYGQMAAEFDSQIIPLKEIEALKMYQYYSLLNRDTLNFIRGIESESNAYYLMEEYDKVIECLDSAYSMYIQIGNQCLAARCLPTLIPIYLERGDIAKAEEAMGIFESSSLLFNENGEIDKGFWHYYNSKALYYEYSDKQDSAEYYYRKLACSNFKYDAYKGLLSVYSKRKQTDSIIKYSDLKENAFVDRFSDLHTQAMIDADAMYDYSRHQRIASEKNIIAERNKTKAIVIGFISFTILTICCIFFMLYRKKEKEEKKSLYNKLVQTKYNYRKAKEDYNLMTIDYELYKTKKEQEIQLQEKKIKEISSQFEKLYKKESIIKICNSDIIQEIKEKAIVRPGMRVDISNQEWNDVFYLFKEQMPNFYASIICNRKLSDQEQKIIILIMSGFNSKTISIILNTSISNVSNAKSSINEKLFNNNSAKKLFENLCGV